MAVRTTRTVFCDEENCEDMYEGAQGTDRSKELRSEMREDGWLTVRKQGPEWTHYFDLCPYHATAYNSGEPITTDLHGVIRKGDPQVRK